MPEIFECEKCDFKCSKLSNYETHLTTLKHKKRILSNKIEHNNITNDKNNTDINN